MGGQRPGRGRHRLLPPVARAIATDAPRESGTSGPGDLQTRGIIRGAVLHLLGEQPVVCDLYGYPSPPDISLVCTNVRGTTGKRPVWADHTDSIFYFPWTQIRFLEVPPDRAAALPPDIEPGTAIALRAPDEPDLEIDEEFLRRVRDV